MDTPDYSTCINCGVRIEAEYDVCERCALPPELLAEAVAQGEAARERFNAAERARWNR